MNFARLFFSASLVSSILAACSGSTSSTSTASAGSGAAASASQSATASATSGGGGCGGGCGLPTEQCCNGTCAATYNDIKNCGSCNNVCSGDHPYCGTGKCSALGPPCTPDGGVDMCPTTGGFCCGQFCCSAGQLCCYIESNIAMQNPQCADPVNGTCPIGCPGCP